MENYFKDNLGFIKSKVSSWMCTRVKSSSDDAIISIMDRIV